MPEAGWNAWYTPSYHAQFPNYVPGQATAFDARGLPTSFAAPYFEGSLYNPTTGSISTATPTAPATPKAPTPAAGYTPSPAPVSGSNPFGYIPGQLGLPDPGKDLQAQIPGLQGLNAQASGVISDYLGGQLPGDVQRQIQDAAAAFGVRSGMPGAGLVGNRTARDLGLTSLDLTNRGLAAYNPFVQTVSSTQTLNPAIQAQIAETNSINAAAPDPTQAASYAKQLYDQYLANLSKGAQRYPGPSGGTGGGPSGGTGSYAPRIGSVGGGGYAPRSTPRSSYGGYGGNYSPVDDFGLWDQSSINPGGYGMLTSGMNPEGFLPEFDPYSLGEFGNNLPAINASFGLPFEDYSNFFDSGPTYEDWVWDQSAG